MISNPLWRIAWLALAVAVLPTAGCEKPPSTSHEPGAPGAPARLSGAAVGKNVLLITMDTTRAGRLGCYGWKNAKTPVLDALAARGVRFERAYTPVPITLPAHVTIFTGVNPPEHGVRDNGTAALGLELPVLTEFFQKNGYRTGGFIGAGVLNQRYGLRRGFDEYTDEMPSRVYQRDGSAVSRDAIEWLNEDPDKPFFCFVHYYDPHTPLTPSQALLQQLKDPYDAEVAGMDQYIGQLIDWLRAHNKLEQTLIVAVADHGESLGDHGFQWHALLLYEGILRIPLIVSLPGVIAEGRATRDVVRLADVMPTILELMGWPIPAEGSGASFAAALAGGTFEPRAAYGETLFPFNSFGWSPLTSLVEGSWKYIHGPRPELYDVEADPGELTNLLLSQPARAEQMRNKLAAIEEQMIRREPLALARNEEEMQSLRSLGYVGADTPPSEMGENLRNPVEMAPVLEQFRLAQTFWSMGRYADVITALERVVAVSPDSFALVELLGKAYVKVRRLEDAQRTLWLAAETGQATAETYLYLSRAMAGRGSLRGASEWCDKALQKNPKNKEAAALRKRLNEMIPEAERRREQLEAHLQEHPDSPQARVQLAAMWARENNLKLAIKTLQAGLALNPDEPLQANALAWFLSTSWAPDYLEPTEAIRLAERAVEQATNETRANFLHTLAAAYAAGNRFEDALRVAKEAHDVARAVKNDALAETIERETMLFRASRPLRDLP